MLVVTSPDTKTFFKTLYPKVQSAEDWGPNKPKRMLNIGLTFNGIQALNVVDPTSVGNFPTEFQAGPWSDDSQQSLGDAGDPRSDPSFWWFNNFNNEDLHCVVHVYGLTQADLDSLKLLNHQKLGSLLGSPASPNDCCESSDHGPA